MENASPVVPQDWRALWKIKTTNSSGSAQLTNPGSPTPPSNGKPATPEDADATVEPVKMSKAARKRANRNARMAAAANTAPSAVIVNCPSLPPLQDMKIPSEKTEPPAADPGDAPSESLRRNNKRLLSRCNTAEERANKRIFLRNLPLEISMNEVKAIVPEVVDLKLIPKPGQGESYAVLEFASEASATDAYEVVSKANTINGKTFIVDLCGTKLNPKQLLHCGELDMLTLFVSGLKFPTPLFEIRNTFPSAVNVFFGRSGRRTPNNKRHLPDNSYVFVMFATEEAAREAFCQESVIDGHRVQVQYAYKSSWNKMGKVDMVATTSGPGAEDGTKVPPTKKQKTGSEIESMTHDKQPLIVKHGNVDPEVGELVNDMLSLTCDMVRIAEIFKRQVLII